MQAGAGAAADAFGFFGIDAVSGGYLLAGPPEDIARLALADNVGPDHADDIQARLDRSRPGLGVADTVEDVTDLAQTGWGVIFGPDVTPDVRLALKDLLAWRRAQASQHDPGYYREYDYQPGETKQAFLRRLRVPPSGAADPARMPYYLLIVGDPAIVPYSFQYQLDVQYAVGRVHFDTPEEYANYARAVVESEAGNGPRRVMTFFGVQNPDDAATSFSTSRLIRPLAERVRQQQARRAAAEQWTVRTVLAQDASKERLSALLGGPETPGLLFTASHGIGFPAQDQRQREYQGALVCSDWPGPREWAREIPPDFYLAADDVADQASLHGMIAVHFACYGAGTPQIDEYPYLRDGASSGRFGQLGTELRRVIADRGFVARLAQRLVGHPRGGALAVVGHVERALGSSFLADGDPTTPPSLGIFEDMVRRLLAGVPVGNALEPFNQRYAELCADLTAEVREVEQSAKRPKAGDLARLWTGSADARGYVIIGDPAVRLAPSRSPTPAREVRSMEIGGSIDSGGPPVAQASGQVTAPPVAHVSELGAPRHGVRIELDPSTGRVTIYAGNPGGETHVHTQPGLVDGDVSFGLLGADGSLSELRSNLTDALKNIGADLARLLSSVARDVTTVEVVTYTGEDLDGANFDEATYRFVGGPRRRAVTRARLDGSVHAIVPELDGKIDEPLWAIHREMVERAQAQRLELLKSVASVVSSLLSPLKGL